ncbi:Hypothetical protein POVR1_LOCUS462 [uncultured virus]|nr:Hypothetical protein POVR1_LOCUS462 [uncultured virus]
MDLLIKHLTFLSTIYLAAVKKSGLFTPESFRASNEFLFGGLSFFVGIVVLINLYPPHDSCYSSKYHRRALIFTIIYLYLDHSLDNPHLTSHEKKLLIEEIRSLMNGDSIQKHRPIQNLYQELIAPLDDSSRMVIRNLFAVVVKSVEIQYQDHSIEQYLEISKEKGEWTIYTMYVSVTGKFIEKVDPIYQELFKLGECVQLFDDLVDTSDDHRSGIKTIATNHLETFGSLDRLEKHLRSELKLFPPKLETVSQLMIWGLDYLILRSKHFSSKRKMVIRRRFRKNGMIFWKLPGIRHRLEKEFRDLME